jgi:hypothetical protein
MAVLPACYLLADIGKYAPFQFPDGFGGAPADFFLETSPAAIGNPTLGRRIPGF